MNDRAGRGRISLEEALTITYLRHGRAELDGQLEEVFGTSDLNSGKSLALSEFLACLHHNQVKQLLSRTTAKTYKPGVGAAGAAGSSQAATSTTARASLVATGGGLSSAGGHS